MKKYLLLALLAPLMVPVTIVGMATPATATPPNPEHKVTLCHRTGSATNPYVQVTVDIASSGYVKGGHDAHEQVGNGLGGDIIPPYTYTAKDGSTFDYPGKNWDEAGQVIFAAGCTVPGEPTETPPPPTPPVIEPAANIVVQCGRFTVTLDNTASKDGDEEGGTAQFFVEVNGDSGEVINVAAGQSKVVRVEVEAGDAVRVLDGRDGTVLAAGRAHPSNCPTDEPNPPKNDEPKGTPNEPKNPSRGDTPRDLAYTGLNGGQVTLAVIGGLLALAGAASLFISRRRRLA